MKAFQLRVAAVLLAAAAGSCASPQTAIAPAQASANLAPSTSPTPPASAAAPALQLPAQLFEVSLDPALTQQGKDALAGRLIILAVPWDKAPPAAKSPEAKNAEANSTAALRAQGDDPIAAAEVAHLGPGESVTIDADAIAFPAPMSKAPPGDYAVQAVLDVNHTYAYSGLGAGDLLSPIYHLTLPGGAPRLSLKFRTADSPLARPPEAGDAAKAFEAHLRDIDFESPLLSAFWGRPMHIHAWLLLPPGYETSKDKYPTVYRAEGFGGSRPYSRAQARQHWDMMKAGETPPMIRVFLDHSSPWGTTEFADSVNNGPWGEALSEELIPWLEKQYRMDAKPSGRFTTGHSSGGWFAIWQQVRYPKIYGGTWARAPDPVDFRSFTGVDIYAANANAYRRPDGATQTLVRDAAGKETTSLKDYAQSERVLGDYGGQFDSFNWVFSPKGDDGRPMPLFDRTTGVIDPRVAQYWRSHYDISAILRRDWPKLKPNLDGKIHVIIGDTDTFHLNEAAQLLKQEMDELGARATFTFIPRGTHFNLDRIGCDPHGLEKKIAWEMWAVARPHVKADIPPSPPCNSGIF